MRTPAVLVLVLVVGAALRADEQPSTPFALTVDNIMRGPDLVGYPPNGLRWSGDSASLYFEWRRPGEDEAATWVVGRAGGAPRRLTDEERRSAPLVSGQWNADRSRILGTDRGDIVVIDTVNHRRIDVTRTTAAESNPRWTRNGTAVTFVRENNLYLVPLGGEAGAGLVQLTDVLAKKTDAGPTDSQRALRAEQADLLTWVEAEKARRQRREARDLA
ncbi:MAG: TolB family protein, partial [Vicinamibacterales bacterium]